MGKNFYGKQIPTAEHLNKIAQQVLQGELGVVKTMLKSFEEVHIGKSSVGWRFLFDGNNQEWKTIQQYKDWIANYEIYDEYGNKYTQEEFWKMVEEKQSEVAASKKSNPNWYIVVDGYEFSTSTNFC